MGWVVVREDGSRVLRLQPIFLPPLRCGTLRYRQDLLCLEREEPAVPPKPKPRPWAVALAVALSILAAWLLGAWLLAQAKIHHGPENVFYKHVDASMLDPAILLQYVILPVALFLLFYPVTGLLVTFISGVLAAAIGRVYEFPRDPSRRVHPDTLLIYAAAWPVTMWLIPLLIFAWVMGHICKPLWKR